MSETSKELSPPIREFMTTHPYMIQSDESVSAAEKLMFAHHVRHLPVLDGKKIIGVISDRDIGLARATYRGRAFDGQVPVKDICLFDSNTFDESEPTDVVARTMAKHRIDAVVITSHGKPVGIFTATDACRQLADLYEKRQREQGILSKLFGI